MTKKIKHLSILMRRILLIPSKTPKGRRGHDRMVVGFKTTCVISAYHY
jgi:hypothetical protein